MDSRTTKTDRDRRMAHSQEYYDHDDDEEAHTRAGGSRAQEKNVQSYGKVTTTDLNTEMDVDQK